MLHCDLRLRWKVASDLRFRAAAISETKTPSFCGISGDLAPSTRESLAIAMVRFWCAKHQTPVFLFVGGILKVEVECSSEIEIFKPDCFFFNPWALRVALGLGDLIIVM